MKAALPVDRAVAGARGARGGKYGLPSTMVCMRRDIRAERRRRSRRAGRRCTGGYRVAEQACGTTSGRSIGSVTGEHSGGGGRGGRGGDERLGPLGRRAVAARNGGDAADG
jgi:hypothetical protein